MKVVLAGGAGSLGRRIADDLAARGDEVVVLTRSPGAGPHRQVGWDGRTVGPWAEELEGAALVNLAGALVDRPATAANLRLLVSSRVEPTRALVEAARTFRPTTWVQSSTLAIYGDAGDVVLDESSPPADGPAEMAGVARAWEAAAAGAPCDRLTVLRTGIVLDRESPALDRLTGLARWGLGGRIGSGRQWVSWIHVDDFLAVVRRTLDDPAVEGVLHVTGPEPATNAALMAAVRRAVGRRFGPPTPAFLVHLGAVLLRTNPALALTGRRAVPRRLTELGFEFRHPGLDEALEDLLR